MTTDDGDDAPAGRQRDSAIRPRIAQSLPDVVTKNLTTKLLILLLLGTVISGAVVVVSYSTINDEITDQVRAQVTADTTTQATVYENWLTERWTTLNAMAESGEMQHDSSTVLHQWLVAEQTRVSNDIHSLYVADSGSGEILGSTQTEFHGANVYEKGLDKSNAGNMIFISQQPVVLAEELPAMTLIGTHSGDRMLLAAVPANTPLVSSQLFEGAQSSLYSLEGHRILGDQTAATMELPADARDETVVMNDADTILGVRVIGHDVLNAQPVDEFSEGTHWSVDAQSVEEDGVATTVKMAVVTRAPTAEAFAIRDQISRVMAISFGLLLTLLIGTAAVSMRSVTVDVNRLSNKARRISEGSFDVDMTHHRIDEIGTLYQSVGEMRDSLRTRIEQAERREQEMKRAREEAEQSRKKLRQIIDLVPDLIFAKNRDGEYLIANEATADAYGLSADDVEGQNESEVIPSADDSKKFREDDLAVIESGESKFIPHEEITTADGETRILQTTKIPYDVPGGDEDAVLGYSRDVTDLKRYEQTLETQRDNLQVLNQVVRHDIRNKLQLVSAYAEMCQKQLEDGSNENVKNVLEATRDAIDITETARDVTEVMLQSEVERSPVRLRYVLEEEIDDIRAGFDTVRITVDGSIPDVDVIADDMLESMFRNLLHNAVLHNDKDVPEIVISAELTNDHVVVQIADNGPGIPDGQKELIFQEGEVGIDSNGTGLGLYLVDTLVDRYGGDIRVKDNEPTGSVFVVKLPVST